MALNSLFKLLAICASAALLASCSVQAEDDRLDLSSDSPIVFATFECCEVLDPANTYSSTDWPFMQQIYGSILNVNPATGELEPELAESAGFVEPNRYRVVIRQGLRFTNGNPLTASDAVHSLSRIINIDSPNGPQILLENVEVVELVDEATFDLQLKIENDNTIENVLASMVGLIVDEDVFPADAILSNQEIVRAAPFSGPYVLDAFEDGALMSLAPNLDYKGLWGVPRNSGVIVRTYQDLNNMVSDFNSRQLDIVFGYRTSLLPKIAALGEIENVVLTPGPSVEGVYLWLSHDNLPYGKMTPQADETRARDFRNALALLIDRKEISDYAYFGTYMPMTTAVPADLPFSIGSGPEDPGTAASERVEAAANILKSLGLNAPVSLELLTSETRWGDLSVRLSTIVAEQLERSGLFDVSITSLEWSEFRGRRKEGTFELSLQMWGHDFSDADNYLTPLVTTDSWVSNGYSSSVMDNLVREQASADSAEAREMLLAEIQRRLVEDLPFIPLVSGGPFVISRDSLEGADTLVNTHWKLIFPWLTH